MNDSCITSQMHKTWEALSSASREICRLSFEQIDARQSFVRELTYKPYFLLDYTRQKITDSAHELLFEYASHIDLSQHIEALFQGIYWDKTNAPILHPSLRAPADQRHPSVKAMIEQVLRDVQDISDQIRRGQWELGSGKALEHIVYVGTGGSILSVIALMDALQEFNSCDVAVSFLQTSDPSAFARLKQELSPETTLCIVASKSFKTEETVDNFFAMVKWFNEAEYAFDLSNHFILVASEAAREDVFESLSFKAQFLPMPERVTGRFSACSAIGLLIAIKLGFSSFEAFLSGAYAVDVHFREATLEENVPAISALVNFWNLSFMRTTSQAMFVYDHRLKSCVDFVQQLMMESNSKCTFVNGNSLEYPSMPAFWGGEGQLAQHSVFQYLYQGSCGANVNFLAVKYPHINIGIDSGKNMLACCLLQADRLYEASFRRDSTYVNACGVGASSVLLLREVTAEHMGALFALYEHIAFVQSVLWQIDCFSQPGVEAAKKSSVLKRSRGAGFTKDYESL